MRHSLSLAAILLTLLAISPWGGPWAAAYGSPGGKRSPVRVYVDLDARIYWCGWSEFCKSVKRLDNMDLCRARRLGYQPAANQTCSADCQVAIDENWFPKEAALDRESGGVASTATVGPTLRMVLIALVCLGFCAFVIIWRLSSGKGMDIGEAE